MAGLADAGPLAMKDVHRRGQVHGDPRRPRGRPAGQEGRRGRNSEEDRGRRWW